MATYKLNKGYESEKDVEAANFIESGSLVIFYSSAKEQVFAIPTSRVHTIEKVVKPTQ